MTSSLFQSHNVAMVASVGAHALLFAGITLVPAQGSPQAPNRLRVVQLVPLPPQASAPGQLPGGASNSPLPVPPLEVIPTVPSKPYDPSARVGATPGSTPAGGKPGIPNQPVLINPTQIPRTEVAPNQQTQQTVVLGRVVQAAPPKPSPQVKPSQPSSPALPQVSPGPIQSPNSIAAVSAPPPLENVLEAPLPSEFYPQAQELGYVPAGDQVGVSTVVGIAEVEVSPDGQVSDPVITVATSVQKLDDAAKAAIKEHFKPQATGTKQQVVFRFALNRTQPNSAPIESNASPQPQLNPRTPEPGQSPSNSQEPVLPLGPGNGKLLDLGIDEPSK